MPRRYQVNVEGKLYEVEVLSGSSSHLNLRIDNEEYQVEVSAASSAALSVSSAPSFAPAGQPASQAPSQQDADTLYAPMPGLVVSIDVEVGDSVTAGTQLLTLEAMKMENGVNAPRDVTVKEILVKKGEQVESGSPLIAFE